MSGLQENGPETEEGGAGSRSRRKSRPVVDLGELRLPEPAGKVPRQDLQGGRARIGLHHRQQRRVSRPGETGTGQGHGLGDLGPGQFRTAVGRIVLVEGGPEDALALLKFEEAGE